jgi:hypothetical protein
VLHLRDEIHIVAVVPDDRVVVLGGERMNWPKN